MPNNDKPAPEFYSGESPCQRISPWRMFIGAMIPNWLMRRPEVSQGAKLAYARLAQYWGRGGKCHPKQKTLAAELSVGERMARNYLCELVTLKLIESDQPGLRKSNRYFFLDHPWMHEGQPEAPLGSGQDQQESSGPDRQNFSGQDRRGTSVPIVKENQEKGESEKREHTHHVGGLPVSLEEAVKVAQQLGIEEEFARQEYHAKKSVGWKDGYGNHITSWLDHLQARWPVEQRKRGERRAKGRTSAKRPPSPPRQFRSSDYDQPV